MENADILILNTCHIREKATEKMYSELGRIQKIQDRSRQTNNNKIIIVAGCIGQAEGEEIFTRAPYVDIIVGPQSYHTLPDLVSRIENKEKNLIDLDFTFEAKFDKLPENTNSISCSSYVSIQEGCDKFCTFCVVPYTRGAEFSRPLEQIYREVLYLTSKGAKEIILLGQNVNAYHGTSINGKICTIADLISHIAQISGLERIRYMTSHPKDMSDDLIALHGTEPKLMPFLHLPIQSGSDKILKDMNRKHNREYYIDIIDRLRSARNDIMFSSDFIVGFPGETELDFADTLDLVRKINYSQCYSFKYSARPGTPAATRQQIPEHIKDERLAILQRELKKQQFAFNAMSINRIMPILFDRAGKFENQIIGNSPYMQSVHIINSDKTLFGQIANVKIIEALPSSLAGQICV
jgi:tRNA-2-methylthio-N6-dimethylallyladenosine synthase